MPQNIPAPLRLLAKLLLVVIGIILLAAGLFFSVFILTVAGLAGLAALSYVWWQQRNRRVR